MRGKPIFVEPLVLSGIAGSATAGYPASNLGRLKAMGLTWRNPGGGTVTGNFDGAREVDFCAMLSANASSSTTIRTQVGGHDSTALPFIDPAITRRDGLYHSFHRFPAPVSASSWSVTVSHSGMFEAPILVLGKIVEPARFYDYDHEFGIEDTREAEWTRDGVWNEQDGMVLRTVDMTLNWQSEAEWEDKFRPLVEQVGTTQPLYLCWDPEATTYRHSRTFYGKFRKAPAVSGKRNPNWFGGDYQMLSLI